MARHLKALDDLARVRDQEQRHRGAFPPGHGRNLSPPHESAVGPDAVAIEPTGDPSAHREGIAVVREHHDFAEQLIQRVPEHKHPHGDK